MQLTPFQLDAIKEIVNIGVGQAAKLLNELTAYHINLYIPEIKILNESEISEIVKSLDNKISAVQMKFKGSFIGNASLVFPVESTHKLVSIITDDTADDDDFDSLRTGVITEIGNIIINGILGAISNYVHENIIYSIPSYFEEEKEKLLEVICEEKKQAIILMVADTKFHIQSLDILGNIIVIFELTSFNDLIEAIENTLRSHE
ncbi:MAG: chemotaxis protein CheC [Spirochaetes bacterium]|nr:chemotaxis protein CheC [Spirochaetota bacterium]